MEFLNQPKYFNLVANLKWVRKEIHSYAYTIPIGVRFGPIHVHGKACHINNDLGQQRRALHRTIEVAHVETPIQTYTNDHLASLPLPWLLPTSWLSIERHVRD